MTIRDLYLLSPELALVGLGLLVIAIDLFVKRKGIVAIVGTVGLIVPIVLASILWADVQASGSQVGIFGALVVDRFALFFKFLVLISLALVFMGSVDYMAKLPRRYGEYYGLLIFSASGMMLLAATTELVSIYISLELTTLPLVALAAFLRDDRSSEAAMKFLILAGISSAVLLYGMVLVFGFSGSTYLNEIAVAVSRTDVLTESPALLLGIVLIVAGFGFKISAVPFHMWVPDVYEGAPIPVVAFLSVASKAVSFAILMRMFYIAFPSVELDWAMLFAALAVASMTVGNLVAIAQSNIKRLLGYSAIAHAGYLLVGLAAVSSRATDGETLGPSSVLFYLGAYAVTNLTAFFAIIAISNKIESDEIDDFAGMSRRSPMLALSLAVSLVALIGFPPTGIFFAKIYIFSAAVKSDLLWLAIVGVLNSLISAYYYLRIVRVMYLDSGKSADPVSSSVIFRATIGITTLAVIILGVLPGPLLRVADSAVRNLLP